MNNVIKTETDFGLENHNGRITADGGKTYLLKYDNMSNKEFEALVTDIEFWLETELSQQDRHDLINVLR